MDNFEYIILNYWIDLDDLYVNYLVYDKNNGTKANAIYNFNTSDIGCDCNSSSSEEIKSNLQKLLKINNGIEFTYPKVSELSSLLKYVYNFVCESESNMCHIDYDDWQELIEEEEFTEEDIDVLKKEFKKYKLDEVITIDDGEYMICGYGCLQCYFNDDTREKTENFER